jgi:putative phosphoesterase
MRIGVVSDTHNNVTNVRRIVALFNQAGVERVVHTGDITQAKTLELFSELACPLFGVYGNTDERGPLGEVAARLGFELHGHAIELDWAGRKILVVHDPLDLADTLTPYHHVVLHGHTHRRVIERDKDSIVFNPGECAGHMADRNAVGVLELATLETELLTF